MCHANSSQSAVTVYRYAGTGICHTKIQQLLYSYRYSYRTGTGTGIGTGTGTCSGTGTGGHVYTQYLLPVVTMNSSSIIVECTYAGMPSTSRIVSVVHTVHGTIPIISTGTSKT